MSGSGSVPWNPLAPVFGPLPYAEIPTQPEFPVPYEVSWDAYDVPRMWDWLAEEIDLGNACHTGWEQVQGFAQLAQLLTHQYRVLLSRRNELSQAWQSPAGQVLVAHLDTYAESLLSEAHCAEGTSHGLNGILTGFGEAKAKMKRVEDQWNSVTTDWVLEFFDDAAAELNVEARNIMVELDAVVRDNRKRILIPEISYVGGVEVDVHRTDPPPAPDQQPPPRTSRIPPVPGYDPVAGSGSSQAELAGIPGVPSIVPAVPGAPVSMLPIPPGSPLAPYGGAYILPGPGVGKGGYVVPMPPGGGGRFLAGPGGFVPGRPGAAGGSGMGMMPVPLGTPMPGGAGGNAGGGLYRRPNTTWQTDKGVPPVIGGIADDVVIADRPSERQEATFQDWFAELAYPWRKDNGEPQPQVLFRRTPE